MAELVDALVSNTSELTLVPVRPRLWVLNKKSLNFSDFFVLLIFALEFYRPFVSLDGV